MYTWEGEWAPGSELAGDGRVGEPGGACAPERTH